MHFYHLLPKWLLIKPFSYGLAQHRKPSSIKDIYHNAHAEKNTLDHKCIVPHCTTTNGSPSFFTDSGHIAKWFFKCSKVWHPFWQWTIGSKIPSSETFVALPLTCMGAPRPSYQPPSWECYMLASHSYFRRNISDVVPHMLVPTRRCTKCLLISSHFALSKRNVSIIFLLYWDIHTHPCKIHPKKPQRGSSHLTQIRAQMKVPPLTYLCPRRTEEFESTTTDETRAKSIKKLCWHLSLMILIYLFTACCKNTLIQYYQSPTWKFDPRNIYHSINGNCHRSTLEEFELDLPQFFWSFYICVRRTWKIKLNAEKDYDGTSEISLTVFDDCDKQATLNFDVTFGVVINEGDVESSPTKHKQPQNVLLQAPLTLNVQSHPNDRKWCAWSQFVLHMEVILTIHRRTCDGTQRNVIQKQRCIMM